METSVFLKTMNNQTQRSPSRVLAVLILWAALPTVPAHGQTQESSGPDHFAVPLSDPSRPARVEASLVNGGITVKGYDGKEVVVEARARNRESARSNSNMKRIIVSSTGLSVEEENNQVRINTDSYIDRKSTRLNSSHRTISYAVFCLKKKKYYLSISRYVPITEDTALPPCT